MRQLDAGHCLWSGQDECGCPCPSHNQSLGLCDGAYARSHAGAAGKTVAAGLLGGDQSFVSAIWEACMHGAAAQVFHLSGVADVCAGRCNRASLAVATMLPITTPTRSVGALLFLHVETASLTADGCTSRIHPGRGSAPLDWPAVTVRYRRMRAIHHRRRQSRLFG